MTYFQADNLRLQLVRFLQHFAQLLYFSPTGWVFPVVGALHCEMVSATVLGLQQAIAGKLMIVKNIHAALLLTVFVRSKQPKVILQVLKLYRLV